MTIMPPAIVLERNCRTVPRGSQEALGVEAEICFRQDIVYDPSLKFPCMLGGSTD